jgi:ABC-2 type transport system permease protein
MRALRQIAAIIEVDLRKLKHDPTELITRTFQPVIWLLLFGQAMARLLPGGKTSYLDFIAPGILAQSILFISIFYGIALIWEKDFGMLHKVFVSPISRSVLVVGRALAAGVRSISQTMIIYILSLLIGINISLNLFHVLGVILMAILGACVFSTFSLIIAAVLKKRERFMGVGQLLTMPFFFTSNALYPIADMPTWFKVLSHLNPMTYMVDAFRALMIVGEVSQYGLLFDYGVMVAIFALLAAIAAPLYPRIIY